MTKIVFFGDPDSTNDAEAVYTAADKEENVDLYVNLGDNGYDEEFEAAKAIIDKHFPEGSEKRKKLRLVLGNHDHEESEGSSAEPFFGKMFPDQYKSQPEFANTAEDWEDTKWLFADHVGDIFFFGMNSQDEDLPFKGRNQYNWVEKQIGIAKQLKQQNKVKWVLSAIHKPWATLKSSHDAYTNIGEIYSPLFENVVNQVYFGHNHNDQAWKSYVRKNSDGNASIDVIESYLADGKTVDHSKPHGFRGNINGHSGHEHNKFKQDAANNKNVEFANETTFTYMVAESNGDILNTKWKDKDQKVLYEYNISQKGTVVDPNPTNCPDGQCKDPQTGECRPVKFDEKIENGICVKVPVDPVNPEPNCTCPTGYTFDKNSHKCVKNGTTDPHQCPPNQHWDEAEQKCIPDLTPPFKKCAHGEHWDYTLNKCVPNTQPEQCPVGQHWDSAQNKCVPDIIVDPDPTGELDSNGVKWLVAKGKQSVIEQSRDEATDDRWSGNITGLFNGFEATFYGKSIGTNSSSHFAMKQFSGNHSGSGASKNAWYDTGLRVDGTVQLQTEFPHPSNHDFSLSDTEQFIKKISKGLEGNMLALKWCVMLVKPNSTNRKDGIRCRMWVDEDPIDANGKPKNGWKLVYDFVDSGQIIPADKQLVDEQDCEVRRSDTKNHEVLFGGLNVRQL